MSRKVKITWLDWLLLSSCMLLGTACAMSFNREVVFNNGHDSSYNLCHGHLMFCTYGTLRADEYLFDPKTRPKLKPNIEKYLELRYGSPGWSTQRCSFQNSPFRHWQSWLLQSKIRRCVKQYFDGNGATFYEYPGIHPGNLCSSDEGAWCVAEWWSIPLHTLFVPTFLITIAVWIPLLRRLYLVHRWNKKGCCETCGYNLTGNLSGQCPECGQECRVAQTGGRAKQF